MLQNKVAEFKKLLKNTKNAVVVTHFNPDGDAIGSSLGLYHILKKLKIKTTVILPNAAPVFLHWMKDYSKALCFDIEKEKCEKIINKADILFALDFNSLSRLEMLGNSIKNANCKKIMIDHHREPEKFANLYFHSVKAGSTCELIYDWLKLLSLTKHIDRATASCLYTGIMTDTGSFRYRGVNSKTHLIISELLKTGIDASLIHSNVYDTYSLNRLKLIGYCLNNKLEIIKNKAAYFTLSNNEQAQFQVQKGDTEGLVNYPFSIKGIEVCAFFSEAPEGYIKISLRSKGTIDVNTFARKYFNGGGHINAAGGKSFLSLKATAQLFETKVNEII
ncbi:MAG: bifunctional oligoribonuclease/PAP phosphatase NrnA [Bacteroidetes bacterium]|nr:bifunctional oligoribonuclease/PAP phosphatase NrnA [Bacteroidota bacterium]